MKNNAALFCMASLNITISCLNQPNEIVLKEMARQCFNQRYITEYYANLDANLDANLGIIHQILTANNLPSNLQPLISQFISQNYPQIPPERLWEFVQNEDLNTTEISEYHPDTRLLIEDTRLLNDIAKKLLNHPFTTVWDLCKKPFKKRFSQICSFWLINKRFRSNIRFISERFRPGTTYLDQELKKCIDFLRKNDINFKYKFDLYLFFIWLSTSRNYALSNGR